MIGARKPNPRVYAILYVRGHTHYVRFDDDRSRERFFALVKAQSPLMTVCYQQDGRKCFIRPSSVDIYVPRSKPGVNRD